MKEKDEIEKEGDIGIKARTVLWYLTFFGFAVNYIIRINVSIAIVDMIDTSFKKSLTNKTIVTSECIAAMNRTMLNGTESGEDFDLEQLEKTVSMERRFMDYFGIDYERNGFKWDEHQQSLILGSFFWMHWASQLPGGILASKYGTKFIFGFANFFACVLCLFMPLACYLNYRWMVGLRLVQGLIAGVAWPAMHNLTGKWIPPNERSKFVTAYPGGSMGAAIAYPLFGLIIRRLSWEYVFHTCGILGIVWYMFWLRFVYNSPEEHPRIHPKEREYILKALGTSVMRKGQGKRIIPWKAILTSRVVWINALAQWGGIWGLFTLLTQAPTYFRFIHGWGIEMTGILSGIPHLFRVKFSMVFSHFGDFLLTTNRITLKNLRRLATFFSMVLNGFACLGLAYSGCNDFLAVLFLTLSLILHGAVSAGTLASMVDIAPNFAGITLGIVSTITIIPGFVSPIVVGYITFENQSVSAWQHIFEISAGMLLLSGTMYIWLNDTSLQPWNTPQLTAEEKEKEDGEDSVSEDAEFIALYLHSGRRLTIKLDRSEVEFKGRERAMSLGY